MTTDSSEISVYNGELTKKGLAEQTARVIRMFPKFPKPMLDELKEAFIDNNFTDERVKHAVNHVRDSYEGWDKLPNIANFVQYDKKVKIYTHGEVTQNNLWGSVEAVDVGTDKPKWALKEDVEKYGLKKWVVKK